MALAIGLKLISTVMATIQTQKLVAIRNWFAFKNKPETPCTLFRKNVNYFYYIHISTNG